MTKILICDDHPVVAAGLRELLADKPEIEVADSVFTVRQIAPAIHHHCPDVLFLDVNMGGENTIAHIPALKALRPAMRVAMFSSYNLPALVSSAFSAGADAYLLKTSTLRDILEAFRTVQRGEKHLGEGVRARTGMREKGAAAATATAAAGKFELQQNLTAREREVFDLIAAGKTEPEIAAALGLSKHTVHSHRKHLMKKLGLHSSMDVLRFSLDG